MNFTASVAEQAVTCTTADNSWVDGLTEDEVKNATVSILNQLSISGTIGSDWSVNFSNGDVNSRSDKNIAAFWVRAVFAF